MVVLNPGTPLAWYWAAGGEAPAPRLPSHSPEAVPVVQLALSQVTLHQMYVLPAGCACAAGGPVGTLLQQAARRELLALQGEQVGGGGMVTNHPVPPSNGHGSPSAQSFTVPMYFIRAPERHRAQGEEGSQSHR